MSESRREQVERVAADHGLPASALKEAVDEVMRERAEERKARREERDRLAREDPAPLTGKYEALQSGEYSPRKRPQGPRRSTMLEDRVYVPGAVRHWRTVHGLTAYQAQARIGYSGSSCSWYHWESGAHAPPYRTLLLILAATGIGHFVDDDRRRDGDPMQTLERLATDTNELTRLRRKQRQDRRAERQLLTPGG